VNLATGILRLALTEPWSAGITRVDQEVELRFRVSPFDLDYNLHMNNAKYLVAMEVVRLAAMKRTGMLRRAVREKWELANAAQQVVFFEPLRLFDRYTVSCGALWADDDWLWLKQHVRKQGRLAATGLFKLRIKQGRAVLSPRRLLEELRLGAFTGARPEEIGRWEEVGRILLEQRKQAQPRPASPPV
jgi:acyl-CoA thioesterase FadM